MFAVWLQFCMILRYLPIYFSLKIGYIKSEGKYKYKKIKNFFTLMKFHEYVNLISRLTFITKAACFENIAISMQFWFEIVTKFLGVRVLGIWVTYIHTTTFSFKYILMLWWKWSGQNSNFYSSSAEVGNDNMKGGKFCITFWFDHNSELFWKNAIFELVLFSFWSNLKTKENMRNDKR